MSKSGSIKDGEKGPYDPVSTTEKASDEIKLEAKMSLLNGVTVIVGSIIGSGIFVSPTGVLKYTGSVNASLLVWTASGIYSMVRSQKTILSEMRKYRRRFSFDDAKRDASDSLFRTHIYTRGRARMIENIISLQKRVSKWQK